MPVVKKIKPAGRILNDNDIGVDYLGHTLYAEALAETIANVSSPITIGVFGRWGSGKTFLIKHVCNLLKRKQQQDEEKPISSAPSGASSCGIAFLVVFTLLFLVAIICILIPTIYPPGPVGKGFSSSLNHTVRDLNSTKISELYGKVAKMSLRQILAITALCLAVFLAILGMLCAYCCKSGPKPQTWSSFKLLFVAAFTKLPVESEARAIVRGDDDDVVLAHDTKHGLREKLKKMKADGGASMQMFAATLTRLKRRETKPPEEVKKPQDESKDDNLTTLLNSYIFVNYNAWACAGSDNLWAGIVTALTLAIEAEFGKVTSRLFRMLEVESTPDDAADATDGGCTRIFAKLGTDERRVKQILTERGSLAYFKSYDQWQKETKSKKDHTERDIVQMWWVTDYHNPVETQNAFSYLQKSKVEVSNADPFAFRTIKPTDDETQPLIGSRQVAPKNRSFGFLLRSHSKVACGVPLFYWLLFAIFIILIPIPLAIYATVVSTPKATAIGVITLLPGIILSVFGTAKFIYAMVHSQAARIQAALVGASKNLQKELGIMNIVKNEVDHVSRLVQCAEFTHKRKYKVVIVIDDLDRIPLPKVKSILEAVNILLSDRASPFVCLISVDSRIAVKSIEEGIGAALQSSSVSGHEYLKKIINLPFCMPQAQKKKQFIFGLIDQSDVTCTELYTGSAGGSPSLHQSSGTLGRRAFPHEDEDLQYIGELRPSSGYSSKRGSFQTRSIKTEYPQEDDDVQFVREIKPARNTGSLRKATHPKTAGTTRGSTSAEDDDVIFVGELAQADQSKHQQPPKPKPEESEDKLDDKEFLYASRDFFQTDTLIQRYLDGNPRNIKRIFNVVSLVATIINHHDEEDSKRRYMKSLSSNIPFTADTPAEEYVRTRSTARDLIAWVILTEQWPYRMSYILQVIEDADQRAEAEREKEIIEDHVPLHDIYDNNVRKEMLASPDTSLAALDGDADEFYGFLLQLKKLGGPGNSRWTKGKAKFLMKYTINLDYSLRLQIAQRRAQADTAAQLQNLSPPSIVKEEDD